jgi:hypothetical protein
VSQYRDCHPHTGRKSLSIKTPLDDVTAIRVFPIGLPHCLETVNGRLFPVEFGSEEAVAWKYIKYHTSKSASTFFHSPHEQHIAPPRKAATTFGSNYVAKRGASII